MDGVRRRVAFVAPSPQARGGIAQFSAHLAAALGSSREVLFPRYLAWLEIDSLYSRASEAE